MVRGQGNPAPDFSFHLLEAVNMYCPACGQQNVIPGESNPNGGELFVAEELTTSIEHYDNIEPFSCDDCQAMFYVSLPDQSDNESDEIDDDFLVIDE